MPTTKAPSGPAVKERQVVVPMVSLPPTLNTDPLQTPNVLDAAEATPAPGPKKSKSTVNRTFDLKDFNSVEVHGHLYVVVKQGDFSVRDKGEEGALERRHLEVGGGTLSISSRVPAQDKTKCQGVDDTKVVVSLPDLASVEVYGSGTVNIGELRRNGDMSLSLQGSGDLLFERFSGLSGLSIKLTGSGDVVGKADVMGLTTVSVSGSGGLHIAGSSKEIDLSVIGSGDLDASELDARQGEVFIQDPGDVNVNRSGPLEQFSNGSADIHLSGNADYNRQRGVEGNRYWSDPVGPVCRAFPLGDDGCATYAPSLYPWSVAHMRTSPASFKELVRMLVQVRSSDSSTARINRSIRSSPWARSAARSWSFFAAAASRVPSFRRARIMSNSAINKER